ncbi:IQ calmodulin-binding motif domain protein [Sarocladium strictum]
MDLDLTMPPNQDDEDDDAMLEDDVLDQDPRIYTPPPHIAARFYRPSHARRRDSAASSRSRRESISSAHSHSRCSSIQPGTHRNTAEEQSKHVAQHLRRASFLEDRRARLADRAAHAEKVRLRAAMVKAAPRMSSASEDRALAAQQAREKNLAKIVADCAEEVKKAKQISEQIKEKREQDHARMKAQMEERMAEASRRREEIRSRTASRRSRGQSVMARKPNESPPARKETEQDSEPSMLSNDDAARMIQGWWLGRIRRKTIQEFNNLGLSLDSIRDASFDAVVEQLANPQVLITTARLLRLCGLHEGKPGSVQEMAAVRTFLSAFLIFGHPNQVLSNKDDPAQNGPLSTHRLPPADLDNPQLQELVGKAKDLLICFENILSRFTSTNRYTMPPALSKALPESFGAWSNAFIAWKSRDADAMVEVMVMQFVELDAILHTVKDKSDEAATELYRQSIRENQLQLMVRVKRIAGPEKGKKMIFDAVAEARKARMAKKQTGDTKPRVAESSTEADTSTARNIVASEPQAPSPASAPQTASPAQPAVVYGGLQGLLPDNRIVVHELAINKEYQVPAEEYKAEQAVLTRPVFEQMRAFLDHTDPETNFRLFLMAAARVKDKLQRLLKPGNSMHKLIGEILDPEIAQQQFTMGSFSYETFFSAMGNLLPKLCAPFRDDEVKDLVRNKLNDGNLIDRIEALNDFIDLMLCDYMNYLLRIAAPQLIDAAAQYEIARFKKQVDEGMPLSAAETAWRSARSKVIAETQKRDPEGNNHPKSRPTGTKFYAQMLVDVFTQPLPINPENVPEMLRLDVKRIEEVSTTVQRIITVGAVLLQCKNLLKRDVRASWKMEAARIMSVLEAKHESLDTTINGTMAALEAGRSMPTVTKTHLRALVTKVLTASQDMTTGSIEPREPVLRLLLTRLRGNIMARLAPGSANEKVKAVNSAGEKLASLGLSEFVDRVRGISDLLEKVGTVDRAAHDGWWDMVAMKVEEQDAASS